MHEVVNDTAVQDDKKFQSTFWQQVKWRCEIG